MKETSKASLRRLNDRSINFHNIFRGFGIDVGPGDDPISTQYFPNIENLILFDQDAGNAEILDQYFPANTFDFIHMSNVLEHLSPHPSIILRNYRKILKKGGFLIITVPDFELYEKCVWPSKYNPDHKWAFSDKIHRTSTLNPFLLSEGLEPDYKCHRLELITSNYNYNLSSEIDQTLHFEDKVECCWEIILENI